MLSVILLDGAIGVPFADCNIDSAISVSRGLDARLPFGCAKKAQQTLAQTQFPDDDADLKVMCVRKGKAAERGGVPARPRIECLILAFAGAGKLRRIESLTHAAGAVFMVVHSDESSGPILPSKPTWMT
jgi:hypothetical protein